MVTMKSGYERLCQLRGLPDPIYSQDSLIIRETFLSACIHSVQMGILIFKCVAFPRLLHLFCLFRTPNILMLY
uniref:Uncharacterized protein n=1 Tax=Rhizophora mucronata TaxID=61149 RepID=A0A2P2IJZ3_RHIMU